MQLTHDFSDFFDEGTAQALILGQQMSAHVERPASASSTLVLSQSVVVSGGRIAAAATPPITAIFNSLTLTGMALFVLGDGSVDLANADSAPVVIGLANQDVAASSLGEYITEGQIERSNWSAVAGVPALSPGAYYYLSSTNGQITSTAPSTPGQSVVVVGRALTATVLDLAISQPILL